METTKLFFAMLQRCGATRKHTHSEYEYDEEPVKVTGGERDLLSPCNSSPRFIEEKYSAAAA
eukprot:12476844-Ditylum_brightwellii.AAC.1